jgi:cold shock CspA family protein
VRVVGIEQDCNHLKESDGGIGYLNIFAESDWIVGIIKWFNLKTGTGFAKIRGSRDILIHVETLKRCGILHLAPGQVVWIRYSCGPKGLMAADLQLSDFPSKRIKAAISNGISI